MIQGPAVQGMQHDHIRRCCRFGAGVLGCLRSSCSCQDWTNYVRIGAYGLGETTQTRLLAAPEKQCVGIEVDRHPGRYESFLHPEESCR